jgi:hypothetical protein
MGNDVHTTVPWIKRNLQIVIIVVFVLVGVSVGIVYNEREKEKGSSGVCVGSFTAPTPSKSIFLRGNSSFFGGGNLSRFADEQTPPFA